MIVVDASAILEVLLQSEKADAVSGAIDRAGGIGHAPHLLDVEILHSLRRLAARGEVTERDAAAVVRDLPLLPLNRYSHRELAERVWTLRHNLTSYDATYVALAEVLGFPLLTCDAKLAGSPGHRAAIELVG